MIYDHNGLFQHLHFFLVEIFTWRCSKSSCHDPSICGGQECLSPTQSLAIQLFAEVDGSMGAGFPTVDIGPETEIAAWTPKIEVDSY